MHDQAEPEAKSSRVNTGGMAVIVLVTLASLGLCGLWVALLASDVLVGHALSGTEWGMSAAYFAVFATAGASIALVFKLLVGKAGD